VDDDDIDDLLLGLFHDAAGQIKTLKVLFFPIHPSIAVLRE
jgi:hypothetical protein